MYQVTAYEPKYPEGRGMVLATPKTLEQANKWKEYLSRIYPDYVFVVGPFNPYHPTNAVEARNKRQKPNARPHRV